MRCRGCAPHNNYSRFIAYYIFWFLCCFQLERSWSCPATMTIILNGTLYVHCTDTRCSRVCPRRTYKSIEQQDHKVINQKTKLEYSVFFFFILFCLSRSWCLKHFNMESVRVQVVIIANGFLCNFYATSIGIKAQAQKLTWSTRQKKKLVRITNRHAI